MNCPRVSIHYGALAPSISEQLDAQGLTMDAARLNHAQWDADAVNRLYVRGLISERVKSDANQRLNRYIAKHATIKRNS